MLRGNRLLFWYWPFKEIVQKRRDKCITSYGAYIYKMSKMTYISLTSIQYDVSTNMKI